MKLRKFKLKHLVSSFLSIMESSKVIVLSLPLCCISMLLGFCHNLSYYFKLRFNIFEDSKMIFLKNAIFYSNFPNFLYYLKSPTLALIIFYGVQGLVYYFTLYLFFIGFLRRFHFTKVLNSRALIFLNFLFQYYVSLFYWIFAVPALELFSNILDCNWYSYLDDYPQCSSLPLYISILSILAMIVTIINGFFILWLYRTYMFLDKGLLKKKFTVILAILYIAKFLLVVVYPMMQSNFPIIVFVALHLIGLYSLFDFIRNFPITNSSLSRFYISILCSFEILCIIFTLFEYTQVIEEPSLFYVVIIATVFSIKLGLKIHEVIYHNMLKSNMDDKQFLGYCLEELYRLYHSRHSCAKDCFFLWGVLKLHVTKCKLEKCFISEKVLSELNFLDLDVQQKIMNNFVSQIFTKNIKEINKKNSSNARNFELIVLKFSSFLNKNNSSPIKAYYEMQKIYSLNSHKSFYFQSISINVLQQIRSLIRLYEFKSHRNGDFIENDKELEVSTFFEMFNEKLFLRRLFIDLLEKRMNFWDKYKDGFHGYSEVFKVLNGFMNEVVNVKNILDTRLNKNKLTQKVIFDLKFKTILECVIFNNVNNAVKNEDELDKIKKKELTLEKNILNCNSFFNNNYTTVQASFLNSNGKILEISKTESLARFFTYSMEEIKSLNEIPSLMPQFLAKAHPLFISYFLKKDRTSKTKERKYVPSFGLDKKGFIFPLKIYTGFNFDYSYDVVFHASLLDLGKREEQIMVFNETGEIYGLTKEFYRFFNHDVGNFKIELMTLMNIFNFVPTLNALIKKTNIFEDVTTTTLINQVCQIYFPQNIDEILTIFALKLKEEAEEKTQTKSYSKSGFSIKTNKTAKSIKSVASNNSSNKKSNTIKSKSTRFLSKFLQTWNKTASEKIEIEQKFQDKEITNYELLDLLIDRSTCRRHKMNFNLTMMRNYYNEKECIKYCQLTVNRMSKDLKDIANQNSGRNKFDTFYDPKTSVMMVAPLSKSELIEKISELEMEPFPRDDSDVKSSFVILPELNVANFRDLPLLDSPLDLENQVKEKKKNISFDNNRLATEENRLMTTENDVLPSVEEEKHNNLKVHMEEGPLRIVTSTENIRDRDVVTGQKIEDKRANRTPPPESFINTSDQNSGIGKLKTHGVNTSNVKIIDANDHSSQKSSITNVKKTFTVFAIINLIQRNFPSSLRSFIFSQGIEMVIIISFCISIYVLSVQYIDNSYNPLNEAVLNFARMYNTYSCTNLVTVEYEYAIYNYSNYQNGYTYDAEFKSVIGEAFDTLKNLNNLERSKVTLFNYQALFKNIMISASDPNKPKLNEYIYVDFLDLIVKQLYELEITSFTDMTLEKLEYFSINYINFLDNYHLISESLDSEFFSTNQTITNGLEIILILFVLLVIVLKCFEYCQLDNYYRKMIRILNIFLRVSQKEAFGEFFLTKDIHQVLKDPMDAYLNYNYIDKVLMKREYKLLEFDEEQSNRSNTNKKKNTEKKSQFRKKLSFQDLKPLSRLPLLCFICFFGGLVLIFIGMNYYYFVFINDKVKNLIDITLFFEHLYTLPTTVLMVNRIILRERVITNQLYKFPDRFQRQQQLNDLLEKYVDDLKGTTALISLYSLNAMDNIQKADFPFIIYGDACKTLIMNNLIAESDKIKCEAVLNTAFQKGILNIVTEILRGITDDEEFRKVYANDTAAAQAQQDGIISRLAKNVGVDRVTADYFLNKLLMVFYNDLENYYRDEMLLQIGNLKIVILLTTIILSLIMIVAIWSAKNYYEQIYKNISLTLNLIPYEKLLNDEQTLFLIKKYWRE